MAWVEVRNAELPREVDPSSLLRQRLGAAGHLDAVGMLTSRDVARYVSRSASTDGATAMCVATVGLSNTMRVGAKGAADASPVGTFEAIAAGARDWLLERPDRQWERSVAGHSNTPSHGR